MSLKKALRSILLVLLVSSSCMAVQDNISDMGETEPQRETTRMEALLNAVENYPTIDLSKVENIQNSPESLAADEFLHSIGCMQRTQQHLFFPTKKTHILLS